MAIEVRQHWISDRSKQEIPTENGNPQGERVTWTVFGETYEMDLSWDEVTEFRQAQDEWIKDARKLKPEPEKSRHTKRTGAPPQTSAGALRRQSVNSEPLQELLASGAAQKINGKVWLRPGIRKWAMEQDPPLVESRSKRGGRMPKAVEEAYDKAHGIER